MRTEKLHSENALVVFTPRLDNIPGWLGLSSKKQGVLFELTSHIHQNRQMQMLGEFGELMELYQVQQLIEGEEMKMADYLHSVYPDRHLRTIQRKQQAFAELAATIPEDKLKQIAKGGAKLLSGFDRIAAAAIGDIRNAVREVAMLPASVEQSTEKYLEAVEGKLAEHRQNRRKGKPLHADEKMAAKMTTNAIIHYTRGVPTLKTSAQIRQHLTRVMGWSMEALGVAGTLRCGRIPIPDGILIRRGRPPKKRPAKA